MTKFTLTLDNDQVSKILDYLEMVMGMYVLDRECETQEELQDLEQGKKEYEFYKNFHKTMIEQTGGMVTDIDEVL
jgi:hypothetical protein